MRAAGQETTIMCQPCDAGRPQNHDGAGRRDLPRLRRQLEAPRHPVYGAAGVAQDLFDPHRAGARSGRT